MHIEIWANNDYLNSVSTEQPLLFLSPVPWSGYRYSQFQIMLPCWFSDVYAQWDYCYELPHHCFKCWAAVSVFFWAVARTLFAVYNTWPLICHVKIKQIKQIKCLFNYELKDRSQICSRFRKTTKEFLFLNLLWISLLTILMCYESGAWIWSKMIEEV